MRSLVALAATLVSFVVFTDTALAKRVSVGGTHSAGEIAAKCAAQGGFFTGSDPSKRQKYGGYGCDNGTTGIHCDLKGKCTGIVPRRTPPGGGNLGGAGKAQFDAPKAKGSVTSKFQPATSNTVFNVGGAKAGRGPARH